MFTVNLPLGTESASEVVDAVVGIDSPVFAVAAVVSLTLLPTVASPAAGGVAVALLSFEVLFS